MAQLAFLNTPRGRRKFILTFAILSVLFLLAGILLPSLTGHRLEPWEKDKAIACLSGDPEFLHDTLTCLSLDLESTALTPSQFQQLSEGIDLMLLQGVSQLDKTTVTIREINYTSSEVNTLSGMGMPFPLAPGHDLWMEVWATTLKDLHMEDCSAGALPGGPAWPMSGWQQDAYLQAVMVTRGKEKILLMQVDAPPTSNPAVLEERLEPVRQLATQAASQGWHVIMGGEWGVVPPYYRPAVNVPSTGVGLAALPQDWLPTDWTFAYDPLVPTWQPEPASGEGHAAIGTTSSFFVCSPNVQVLKAKAFASPIPQGTHQPISITIVCK